MSSNSNLWLPPLVPKEQPRIDRQRKHQQFTSFAWAGFQGKTLWDYLQLLAVLAIPVVVAVGTLWFSAAQSQASATSQKLHETDVQIARDQQQETALQNYLDHMSDLLLNDNLRNSKPGDEVRNIARARTLTVLPQLNGTRKREIIGFLYESGLISIASGGSIISLYNADLSGVDLSYDYLSEADLRGANLSGANLSEADLSEADLSEANLSEAGLFEASLSHANLSGADLSKADLGYVGLSGANLSEADLSNVDLSNANLGYVGLSGANLSCADLSNANLNHANLNHAIMPDGSTHS